MACTPWPISWTCDTTDVDPALLARATEYAQSLLWGLSGRSLGICTYDESYWPPCGDGGCPMPYISDGQWHNGRSGAECCRLLLVHRPIQAVSEVTESGVVLAPEDYAFDRTFLRRRGTCWPCANACDDPPVHVVYEAGVPLPVGTDVAMGEVACEFLKELQGQVCKLPSRVTTITRQGVSMTFGSPPEDNRLGLPLVDAWLRVVNPSALTVPSRVYSPDLPRVAT